MLGGYTRLNADSNSVHSENSFAGIRGETNYDDRTNFSPTSSTSTIIKAFRA
jgi:hypothetical protein